MPGSVFAEHVLGQVNQARAMLYAGLDLAPERIDGADRRAHVHVMQIITPSVFLRTVVGVLIAFGLTILGRAVGFPEVATDIVGWAVALAVPSVGIAMWIALFIVRLSSRSIRATLDSDDSRMFLWAVSGVGYVISTTVAAIGVLAFPDRFL